MSVYQFTPMSSHLTQIVKIPLEYDSYRGKVINLQYHSVKMTKVSIHHFTINLLTPTKTLHFLVIGM